MPDAGYIRIQVGGQRFKSKPTIHGWALVDPDDAHLAVYRWSLNDGGYAVRYVARGDGRYRQERMHRIILGLAPGDPRQVDHINGRRLDNRRANLRIVTTQQQSQNMAAHSDARSPYRGVSWFRPHGKWCAKACIAGTHYHIGYYDDELEAAEAARAFREAHMTHNVESRH